MCGNFFFLWTWPWQGCLHSCNSCLWLLAANQLSWRPCGTMKSINGLAWIQSTVLPHRNWVNLNGSFSCTISRMAIMTRVSQNGKCSVPWTPMHVPVQISLQEMWLHFSRLSFPWQLKSFWWTRNENKRNPSVEDSGGSELPGCPVGAHMADYKGGSRPNSYLHGIVESLCKVAVEVPGAFHWQTEKLC